MVEAKKCPKCNGDLSYELCGTYGDVYKINRRTGKMCKNRVRRNHYECDYGMIYCAFCGTNYDYRINSDYKFFIEEKEE